MIELQYVDAYKQVRTYTYDDLNAILLAFSGCITVPDYYKVTSLTQDGKDLGYEGTIGDLYTFLTNLQSK